MLKLLKLTAMASAAGLLYAPAARADQYDYVSELDARGIYYDSMSEVIDMGKLACAHLRAGWPVTVSDANGGTSVGTPIVEAGYAPLEAAIITIAAARHMCPDQLPTLKAVASNCSKRNYCT